MENTNSSEQIVNKQTKIQRRVEFYGFPAPLKVLMDAVVILAIHDKQIGKSLISSYLEHDVQLFATRCTMVEAGLSKLLSKDISVLSCSHGKEQVKTCIQDVIGSTNPQSYFVATGCSKLSSKLRKISSVPVIKFRGGLVRLIKPSGLPKAKDVVQVKGALKSKRAASSSVEDTSSEVSLKKRTVQAKDAGPVEVKGAPKRKRSASLSVEDTSSEVPLKKSAIQVKDAGPLSYDLSDEQFQKDKIAENKKYHWALNPICHDDSSDDDPTHIPAVRRAYERAAGLSSEIDKDPTNTVVFVVGFTISGNFDVVRYQLREVFRSCGDIKRIYITQDKITGLPKNVAFITFADRRSVFKALRLTGTDVGRTTITVQESRIGGRYHRLAGREFVD